MMRRTTAAALAVAAVTMLPDDDGPEGAEYAITYVLNGGTQNDSNPDSYVSGTVTELYEPYSDEMYFDGWYLDEGLTERCDAITEDMTGDITLYAGWTESLVGKGFTLELDGSVSDGPFTTYGVSGSLTMRYLYLDEEEDAYYIEREYEYIYSYRLHSHTDSGTGAYWSTGSDITWSYGGTETIDTIDGAVECEVYVGTYPDGSTETQWIGGGWIPYRVEYMSIGTFSSTSITYTLAEHFTFEADGEVEVTAYGDDGISVGGSGTYTPGETVTLTAGTDGDAVFDGWYDSEGNLLSSSGEYTFEVVAADVTVYARNTERHDVTLQDGTSHELCAEDGVSVTLARVVDRNTGDTVAELTDSDPTMTFSDAGEYIVLIDGYREDGTAYHGFYGVMVDGTVTRTYSWSHGGEDYALTLEIGYADLTEYRDYYTVSERQQDLYGDHARDRTFVTYSDPYVVEVAEAIAGMTGGMTDLERLNVALAFTQSIEYQSDEVFMGAEEYWKFPLETLYDMGGDCEDTSILMAAVSKAMGYDSALLLFTGHMAAGVSVDGCDGVGYQSYGSRTVYYYCETTSTGYDVGERPSCMAGYRATLVVI